jgi:quercetin dioxygenase-like cupin family protein
LITLITFKSGQELGIHSHDVEGQLSIVVLEGEGEFLGKDGMTLPANTGDILISDIREPHGIFSNQRCEGNSNNCSSGIDR